MSFVAVGRVNRLTIQLYSEDEGAGRPVVLGHGWPRSGRSFVKQVSASSTGDAE
jgi:non-heme chloroperoxidase